MKKLYIILAVICVLCVIACLLLNAWYQALMKDDGQALESKRDEIKEFLPPVTDTPVTAPPETEPPETTPPETEPSDSSDTTDAPDTDAPITTAPETEPPETEPSETEPYPLLNFEKLWQTNPEIIAWLDIEGTYIDYPVLQSPDNDKKYLNRAYDGSWYVGGALFTEATYNSTDFNDPVTIIYGHTMPWSILFGSLEQNYSDARAFERNSDITLYLPGETRHYTVFAAVPFSKMHVLDTYDFSSRYLFNMFFKQVGKVREIGANFNRDAFPEWGDRVLILSVCLNEDSTRRYLVMAVLNEDLADNVHEAS